MIKPTIFITGATGKTGFYTARIMLEKGYRVKAMARKQTDKTEALKALGAEVVFADFLDLASLEKAMEGVDRAYFVYPPADGLLEGTANFIVAAQTNSLEAVVNMSQITVRKYHPSPLTNQHWLAEQTLNLTDMTVAHVCPGFFAEMLYMMNGGNILQDGKMYLPHGDAYHAPIAAEDIGRSVAAILENPEKYNRQRLVLTGPERVSQKDIAAIASKVLGFPIEYVAVTTEQWEDAMRNSGLMSEFLIKHLVEVGINYQDSVFDEVTSTIEELTGQKPMNMKTYIESNMESFTPDFLQTMATKLSTENKAA